jgi:hypothetical protein
MVMAHQCFSVLPAEGAVETTRLRAYDEQRKHRTLVAMLHHHVEEMHEQWALEKPLRTGWPHASTILQPEGEYCLRRQVLLVLHPEAAEHPERKPWDAQQDATFLNGWTLHEKLQKLIGEHGQVVYFNDNLDSPELDYTHFDDERKVWFSPDAIAEFGPDRFVWELKFYQQEYFEKLDEQGYPPELAHRQANLYCHLLGLQYGVVYVENKNRSYQRKLWVIEHTPELAWPYTSRMEQVRGAVLKAQQSGKVPARACSSCTEHRAEKCPVRKLCFSGKLREK